MVNRKSNSPWGSSYKEGLPSTAVNDNVDIDQNVKATITTGSIDVATGQWKGVTLSDEQFTIDATHESVADGAAVLSPQRANHDFINMTGYNDLSIAIKATRNGNFGIVAVMGPDTNMYANLTPINAGEVLRGVTKPLEGTSIFASLLEDSAQDVSPANTWNVFTIQGIMKTQKLLQFQITNNTGGPCDIEFAYLRSV